MPQYVTLTIDGAKLRAVKGAAVLDTALEYGICIPHLCHVPGVTAFGGCRLCVVEVVTNGRAKVTASCTLEVREGLNVVTNSDKIRRLRRNLAELLVSEAPNSKALQCMAVRCGVKDVRYPFRRNDCVLCGRCVRVCEEMWQASALGFIGRGTRRHVGFPFGHRPDFCKMCKSCVDLCPMTIAPCSGPMKSGEETLCGRCEAQASIGGSPAGMCTQCELGTGFQCSRAPA